MCITRPYFILCGNPQKLYTEPVEAQLLAADRKAPFVHIKIPYGYYDYIKEPLLEKEEGECEKERSVLL